MSVRKKNSWEKERVVLAVEKNIVRVYRLGKNRSARLTRLIRFTDRFNKID